MMNIPFFRAAIGEDEITAVSEVLASGWLTTGRVVSDFENEFARYLGAPHAVAVNSCTAALHLALEAAGVGPGDLVLVPTMTFAATAEVVRYLSARPVLVDCDPGTLCVDPAAMEATAEKWSRQGRIKAMMPMHYAGQMADMDRLQKLARKYGLEVIEDAAHALPAFSRAGPDASWEPVGSGSLLSCFSFYANKCITTGEGGMVLTRDQQLMERIRVMSLHGLSKSAWTRFESRGSWHYEIVEAGFKYNLTDIAAAIGRVQLRKADDFWQKRRRVAETYSAVLQAYSEFLDLPVERGDRRSSWHLYPIRIHVERLDIDRARFIEELRRRGIICSVHWMPLHLHPYYRQLYGYRPEEFPVASAQWIRLVSLPIFPDMTEAETQYVCDSVGAVIEQHRRCAGRTVGEREPAYR